MVEIMPKIVRTFSSGVMNKAFDDRLVPNGQYRDALNVRITSTEDDDAGVVENLLGNEQMSVLTYNDTPLSSDAVCIGSVADIKENKVYWFVHDPSYPGSVTGKIDLIVSYSDQSDVVDYHVVSINDGSGANTTLNFNPSYLINGVNVVDEFLFFTDNYNPPRVINTQKKYSLPGIISDGITAEELMVIKKPSIEAPVVAPKTLPIESTFCKERFLSFSIRYLYADNQYSAPSPFSDIPFIPEDFGINPSTGLNTGMLNTFNAADVSFNTGSELVKGIDILFKDSANNILRVAEKINKDKLGLSDNSTYTYTFTGDKIYTVLPESELLRLYDNVPLKSLAQTIMGNRLMYGNYVEGYDMVDGSGNPVKIDYAVEALSVGTGRVSVTPSYSDYSYTINGYGNSSTDSILLLDLAGKTLKAGAGAQISMRITHHSFGGPLPYPVTGGASFDLTFSFILDKDYDNAYELATSEAFQNALGTSANIEPLGTACNAFTLTDIFNCESPSVNGSFTKTASGFSAAGQGIGDNVAATIGSEVIGIPIPANVLTDGAQSIIEYYTIDSADIVFYNTLSSKSLHSNRNYEAGIVYMDDFGRSSTVLLSENSSVYIPCDKSDSRNYLRVTIPDTQVAPEWASYYKFVLRQDKSDYDTIFSYIYYQDPNDASSYYFLLEGENAQKVSEGDYLTIKTDSTGALDACEKVIVEEKSVKQDGFISGAAAGVYMKVTPNRAVFTGTLPTIIDGPKATDSTNYFSDTDALAGFKITNGDNIPIPAGSFIDIDIEFKRNGRSFACGTVEYTLKKTVRANQSHDNIFDWAINEGVSVSDGNSFVDGDETPNTNVFYPNGGVPYAHATPASWPAFTQGENKYFFTQDGADLYLYVRSGTPRCVNIFNSYEGISRASVKLTVRSTNTPAVFETIPEEALPDIFFENDQVFDIAGDNHFGNVQDQNVNTGDPAILDLTFFNAYCFGNGVESYKIEDSISGKLFRPGGRVRSSSDTDYKQVRRDVDITWSGIYNDETNVNKFNEFNSALLNYKHCEDEFGSIQVIDGRSTDVLVLQENRISYVLQGKNLLSDAAGGGAITSVPEVLGTQVARNEEYGISINPESYAKHGSMKFFTDTKRGSVISLIGGSYSSEQMSVISDAYMSPWFRDAFQDSIGKQKIGGYDPYFKEYILSMNDRDLPGPQVYRACGFTESIDLVPNEANDIFVDFGDVVGEVTIDYTISGNLSGANVVIIATYAGGSFLEGPINTTGSGSFTFPKSFSSVENAVITAVADGGEDVSIDLTVNCVERQEVTVVEIVLSTLESTGQFIHTNYRYKESTYVSPTQSRQIQMQSGVVGSVLSSYISFVGYQGSGSVPTNGSDVRISVKKEFSDDFEFNPDIHKLKLLRSSTLYGNNINDAITAEGLATEATPINTTGAPDEYYAETSMPASGDYLYIIWDLRSSVQIDAGYDASDANAACALTC
jgi:hypothetical protein